MAAIRATVTNGKIVLDAPAEWPDGTEVELRPVGERAAADPPDGRPETPEEIEAWLKWFDSLEPIHQTQEEADEFRRVLAEQKAIESAGRRAYSEQLRKSLA